ncbi:ribonuclease HI [Pseudomonas nitritireducens]|uniref:Ribonuclease H n=1 Tax=Pseudomonas nitroreducens TaxID=46680 RepID=A0A7W7KF65_PSENT|nr:ribonuclease HI [Pseudomonas nitritireducens]MBB4861286.1 ribonuclease HI [Pseudomonas nitritireducens]
MSDGKVVIYTDGACKGNPGPGGWGYLIKGSAGDTEAYGGDKDTTNNKMEMTAVIEALKSLATASVVVVHTDSKYVLDGLNQWLKGWKAKGWRLASGGPVKNVELWKQLDALCTFHKVEWVWVRGHNGDPGNERADKLANLGVAGLSGR